MRYLTAVAAPVAALCLFLTGCSGAPNGTSKPNSKAEHTEHADDSKKAREASFAKLSAVDRASAEAQGYCAVSKEPLGSMGAPLKVMVNNQPAWVCCKGCMAEATSQPEKTLAAVAELKTKVNSEKSHQ